MFRYLMNPFRHDHTYWIFGIIIEPERKFIGINIRPIANQNTDLNQPSRRYSRVFIFLSSIPMLQMASTFSSKTLLRCFEQVENHRLQ